MNPSPANDDISSTANWSLNCLLKQNWNLNPKQPERNINHKATLTLAISSMVQTATATTTRSSIRIRPNFSISKWFSNSQILYLIITISFWCFSMGTRDRYNSWNTIYEMIQYWERMVHLIVLRLVMNSDLGIKYFIRYRIRLTNSKKINKVLTCYNTPNLKSGNQNIITLIWAMLNDFFTLPPSPHRYISTYAPTNLLS